MFWIDVVVSQYAERMLPVHHNMPVILDHSTAVKPQQRGIHAPGRLSPFVGKSVSRRGGISFVVGSAVEEKMSELNELRKEARELMGDRRRIRLRSEIRLGKHPVPVSKQRTIELVHYRQGPQIFRHNPQLEDSQTFSIHQPGISHQGMQVLRSGLPRQNLPIQHADIPHRNVQIGLPQLMSKEAASRITRPRLSNRHVLGQPADRGYLVGAGSLKGGANRVSLRREQVARIMQQMKQRTRIAPSTGAPISLTRDDLNRGLNGILESIEQLANLNNVPVTRNYRDVNVARSYEGRRRSNTIHSKHVGPGDRRSKYDIGRNFKYNMNSKYDLPRDVSFRVGDHLDKQSNYGNAIPMDVSTRAIRYKHQRLPQSDNPRFYEIQQRKKSDHEYQSQSQYVHTSHKDQRRQNEYRQSAYESRKRQQRHRQVRENPQYPQWMKEFEQNRPQRQYPPERPLRHQSQTNDQYESQRKYSRKRFIQNRQQNRKERYKHQPEKQHQDKAPIRERPPYSHNANGKHRQRLLHRQYSSQSSTNQYGRHMKDLHEPFDQQESQRQYARNEYTTNEPIPYSQQLNEHRHRYQSRRYFDKVSGRENTRHRVKQLRPQRQHERRFSTRQHKSYPEQRHERNDKHHSRRQHLRGTLNREMRRYHPRSREQNEYQGQEKYPRNPSTRRYYSHKVSKQHQSQDGYPRKAYMRDRHQSQRLSLRKSSSELYPRKASTGRQRHYSQELPDRQQSKRPHPHKLPERQGHYESWKHGQQETQGQHQLKPYLKGKRHYSQQPRGQYQSQRTYDQLGSRPSQLEYTRKGALRNQKQDSQRRYGKRNQHEEYNNFAERGYGKQQYTPLRYPQAKQNSYEHSVKQHYPQQQQNIIRQKQTYATLKRTPAVQQGNTNNRDQNKHSQKQLNDFIRQQEQRATPQQKALQLKQMDLPQKDYKLQTSMQNPRKLNQEYMRSRFTRYVNISQPRQVLEFSQNNSINKKEKQNHEELFVAEIQQQNAHTLQRRQQQHLERSRVPLNQNLRYLQQKSNEQPQQQHTALLLHKYRHRRQTRRVPLLQKGFNRRHQLLLIRRQTKTLIGVHQRKRFGETVKNRKSPANKNGKRPQIPCV